MAKKKQPGAPYDPTVNYYMKMHNETVHAKRRNAVIAAVFCVLAAAILIVRFTANQLYVREYRKGISDARYISFALHPNVPEGYVPLYNLGSAYYWGEDYESAANLYYEALHSLPPHGKNGGAECDIRVNLALSVCHQIDFKHIASQGDADAAIETLLTARGFLTENGCANPEAGVFDGHAETAEQLKFEIDMLIEALRNPSPSASASSDSDDNPPKEDTQETPPAQAQSSAMDRLQQEMKESRKQFEANQRYEGEPEEPDVHDKYW